MSALPSSPQLQQLLQSALEHHRAGRLDQARGTYQQMLALDANQPDALHLSGLIAHQSGNNQVACELVKRAVAINPAAPQYLANLGIILHALGNLPEAISAFQRAVDLDPNFADAQNNLGSALEASGRRDDAISQYRRAMMLRPGFLTAQLNLALALHRARRFDEAVLEYQNILTSNPQFFEVYVQLGNLLKELGRPAQAIGWYEKALQLRPEIGFVRSNLGVALRDLTRLEEALAELQAAVQQDPNLAEGHVNLAVTQMELGLSDEGVASARRAVELKPDLGSAWSTYLLSLNYRAHPAEFVLEEHKRWARSLRSIAQAEPRERSPRDSNRPLRIGYVSADFRNHPIAFFLEPLLANHDHQRVHVTCYSDVLNPDAFTRRLQECASDWRAIGGLSDEDTAGVIRDDQIDVLIDLSGHTAGNRLAVFARQPAPVQISYLGYPATSGLPTIRYRITDKIADPPGKTDAFYAEELVRLPNIVACYAPPSDAPPVAPAPAVARGYVTFGSFTNLAKISPESIALWASELRAIPNAKFMLMARGADGAQTRQRLASAFATQGVQASQLDIRGATGFATYLAAHSEVDIVLDTFPFNGHTTLCHALWMGVPVVTLSGDRFASRLGKSLLETMGLGGLVANSADQFPAIADELARDSSPLAQRRESMRARMMKSPLMDAPAFATAFEDLLMRCAQRVSA